MTGPQHYREAERLLAQSEGAEIGRYAKYLTAAAQVHATLADVAATAEAGGLVGVDTLDIPTPWARALHREVDGS
jgi:hypothetical protein